MRRDDDRQSRLRREGATDVRPSTREHRTGLVRRRRFTIRALTILVVLLAAPGWALSRVMVSIHWWIVLEALVTIWVVTYVSYHADKRNAEAGKWRIPEATLHVWELLGGWPAAYVAQRTLRHKIAKRSYQVTFWGIVVIHQFLAGDFLLRWRFTNQLLALFQEAFA